jgi:hypothetical protein
LDNQHHQQHMGEVQEDENEDDLDINLVPFIGPRLPFNADENGDNFELLPDINAPLLTVRQ